MTLDNIAIETSLPFPIAFQSLPTPDFNTSQWRDPADIFARTRNKASAQHLIGNPSCQESRPDVFRLLPAAGIDVKEGKFFCQPSTEGNEYKLVYLRPKEIYFFDQDSLKLKKIGSFTYRDDKSALETLITEALSKLEQGEGENE